MGSIRDMQRYLEANIESAIKVPLRKAKNVVLGSPMAPSVVGITTTKNTVIPIAFDNRKYLIPYNRKDIQAFLSPLFLPGQYLPLTAKHVMAVDVLAEVNKRWGLDMQPEEVVDEPIALSTNAGNSTVRLTMSDKNRWFTGTVQIPVWPMQVENGKRAYVVPWDPRVVVARPVANDTTRKLISATLLTYGVDYSAANTACAAVTQVNDRTIWDNGVQAQQTALASAMKAIDGIPWTMTTSMAAYNLYGSHCLYNGPTEGFDGSLVNTTTDGYSCDYVTDSYSRYDKYVNRAMKNVLVIQLNQNYGATNVGGILFIHYGGPVEPQVEVPYRGPVHYWPLNGDLKNKVSGGPDLKIPVAWWPKPDGTSRPSLSAVGNYPMGVALPVSGDYTLSLTLGVGYRASAAFIGILGDASGNSINGALKISDLYFAYNAQVLHKWAAPRSENMTMYTSQHILTVVKQGRLYRYYVGDILVGIGEAPEGLALPDLTHFGKAGEYFPNNFLFYDFYFYDYAMTQPQVKKLARGDYGRN